MSVHELVSSIKGDQNGRRFKSARFLVNMGSSGIQVSAADFRVMDGKTSVILFGTSSVRSALWTRFTGATKAALERNNCLIVIFAMVELSDIQRSSSNAAGFLARVAKNPSS